MLPIKLKALIKKCRLNQADARQQVYDYFFDFAERICCRYTDDEIDRVEIIEQGFVNVYKYIHHFNMRTNNIVRDFSGWIKKMMLYAMVGHFRNNFKHAFFLTAETDELSKVARSLGNGAGFSASRIRKAMDRLPLSNRLVLALVTIHEFTRLELAQCLEISPERAEVLIVGTTGRFKELVLSDEQVSGYCFSGT